MQIFELGPGRKFRASVSPSGFLKLEIRQPALWEPVTSPDLVAVATNALALAAIGSPPAGFRFTVDDRYCGPLTGADVNPFKCRRTGA
jgi:hypothetical protein